MTALCVFFFFAGFVAGGAVMSWYQKRPSQFDRWRKEQYKKHKDDYQYRNWDE